MYNSHPNLTTPPDNTTIWRYMSLDKFLSILTTKSLWFARPDQFEDAWEGWFPMMRIPNTMLWPNEELRRSVQIGIARQNALGIAESFISCWHMSDNESAPMWKAYSLSKRGVAICTTIGRLKESLSETLEKVYLAEVTYGAFDDIGVEFVGNGLATLCVKRPEFSSERELRAIVWSKNMLDGPCEEQEWDPNVDHVGIKVRVRIQDLIDRVVLAPGASPDFRTTVASLLDTYGVNSQTLCRSVVDDVHPLASAHSDLVRVNELAHSFDTLASWSQSTLADHDGDSLANLLMACKRYALSLQSSCGLEGNEMIQLYREAIRQQFEKIRSSSPN